MDKQPEKIIPFVKALADADRLRIVGLLAQHPASVKEVAGELHLPVREAFNHLAFLEHVNVVRSRTEANESIYELDPDGLKALSRQQFASRPRETYLPAPDLDPKARKVLATYLNADGSIRQIPIQEPAKLKVILDYLVEAFTPGVDYTEKEVNTIIRRFNVDVSGMRRDLIDAGLLERVRDGSRYWRPVREPEDRS
jgi:hypothetical protein